MMPEWVRDFEALTAELQALAGGKGAVLARLYQRGYPVPQGFVVLTTAFDEEGLLPEAWQEVAEALADLQAVDADACFAVRSSAVGEDAARTSFAGEFETVLDVPREAVREAIDQVYRSRQGARARAYGEAHGLEDVQPMAVVVQRMVDAAGAGVLFSADPVSGSHTHMIGNYVHGSGERLVSGEADAMTFRIERESGVYEGPDAFRPLAPELYSAASRLEKELGGPQDIEFAVAEDRLYVLQARPITTLSPGNPDTYEINESLGEDALWINTNVAEAVPDVFSPFTWSIVRSYDEETNFIPRYYVWSGNICGKVYSNISRRVAMVAAVTGLPRERVLNQIFGDLFGQIPDGLQVPDHGFTRWGALKELAPNILRVIGKTTWSYMRLRTFIRKTPQWQRQMAARIESATGEEALLTLWREELEPYTKNSWWFAAAGAARIVSIMRLDRQLTRLVGKEDANALFSNFRSDAELASLGPVLGIAKIAQGELSREAYVAQYGHRGPHEFELSLPHPGEDPRWLEEQIAAFENDGVDIEALLEAQRRQFEEAKTRFEARYPKKARWLERQLGSAAVAARLREAARSEFTRAFRVIRAFALKAGALTGIGGDIFFLYIGEVEALLAGDDSAVMHIAARKENYERYKELPPFPAVIRGRFNPFEWAKNPDRRLDYYDATQPVTVDGDREAIKGHPGAAGRVEGIVRVLWDVEEGEMLQRGEILVAPTTNVGWTPLFPRAAAVVTDIGAPLSHAAIVARELGIPAVVGCRVATSRLRSGDRVRVDGGLGTVELLDGNRKASDSATDAETAQDVEEALEHAKADR